MAQVIPSIPDIDLAGLVDRNQGSADPLARTYEDHSRHMVVVASSIERAAEQVATRAIINVTPPADHAAVARDALRFRHTMASPMLTDMSIHHFDAVPYAHQQDSVWVHALQIDPPWSWFRGAAMVQACLQMSADAVGSHVDSWVGMGRGTSWNGDWEINAADGSSPWDGDSAPKIVGGATVRRAPCCDGAGRTGRVSTCSSTCVPPRPFGKLGVVAVTLMAMSAQRGRGHRLIHCFTTRFAQFDWVIREVSDGHD